MIFLKKARTKNNNDRKGEASCLGTSKLLLVVGDLHVIEGIGDLHVAVVGIGDLHIAVVGIGDLHVAVVDIGDLLLLDALRLIVEIVCTKPKGKEESKGEYL